MNRGFVLLFPFFSLLLISFFQSSQNRCIVLFRKSLGLTILFLLMTYEPIEILSCLFEGTDWVVFLYPLPWCERQLLHTEMISLLLC